MPARAVAFWRYLRLAAPKCRRLFQLSQSCLASYSVAPGRGLIVNAYTYGGLRLTRYL